MLHKGDVFLHEDDNFSNVTPALQQALGLVSAIEARGATRTPLESDGFDVP